MDDVYIGELDLSSEYEITTYPETEQVPVLHIDIGMEEIPDCCIFLTENKFYGKDSLEAEFSRDGLARIDSFLREKHDGTDITNWEWFCKEWNESTPYEKIEFPKEQPNYINTTEVIERYDGRKE